MSVKDQDKAPKPTAEQVAAASVEKRATTTRKASSTSQGSARTATVIMRAHAHGHQAGDRVRVTPETAEFLVANHHADWPPSKQ